MNKNLMHILLASTAIGLVCTAYGQEINTSTTDAQTITTADPTLTVTSNGSITVTINNIASFENAVETEPDVSGATIINNGNISALMNIENFVGNINFFNSASAIANDYTDAIVTNYGTISANIIINNEAASVTNGTLMTDVYLSGMGVVGDVDINDGIIQSNIDITAGTAQNVSGTSAYVTTNRTGHGIYGNVDVNNGVIYTNSQLTGGKATSNSSTDFIGISNAYANSYISNNAIYGNLGTNTGLIKTDLSLMGGHATMISGVDNGQAQSNTTSTASTSANGIYGSLTSNDGIITTNIVAIGGSSNATTNVTATSPSNSSATTFSEATIATSGNGVYGDLTSNTGIISTDLSATGGTSQSTININTLAQTEAGLNAYTYAYAPSSGNGVYGNLETNDGVIQTKLILTGGSASNNTNSLSGTNNADAHVDAQYSSNGTYGDLGINNGTIAAYLLLTPGTQNGADAMIYSTYSGNGATLVSGSTETAINTGSIIASNYTIAASTARNVENYGTLVGTEIYNTNITGTNYGTYIWIDADGNVLNIDNTGATATIDGKTTEQAAIVGSTDSYNIYTSETAIADAIINGAGVTSGVVTLQGTADFTITNSSLNAYHTALDIQTTNLVDASDTYFNGGGLLGNKNIEYSVTDIPVIKGDAQDNYLIVRGNSYINGDVALGDGADIFVLDTTNTTLNGTADLGDADDDTFALYTFTGNQDELRTATQDYASWGMFNAYFGDKVLNFENIGAEVGTITMTDDLTDYGLYIGKKATADFTTNDSYTLKNLRNDGIVNMSDDTAGGHITVGDYLKGTGTYIFDTDFTTLKSDYITVNGDVTANSIIAINDVTGATSTQKGKILLIEAPNDSNKSDEDFNLALANQYNDNSKQGRFTGSPYVWALANSGNDWVLTTTIPSNPVPPTPIPTPTPPRPSVVAEIPAYTSLPTIGREMAMDELGRLHTRLGELRNNQGWVGTGASNLKTNLGSEWHNAIGFDESKANAWLKGTINHFDISSDNSFDVSGTYGGFNLGIDKKFDLGNSSPDWSVFTGLFGGYKTGSFETSGKGNQYTSNEHADIDIDAWSIGGYATFFNTAGTYIDLVAEYMDFSADIDAAGLNSSTDGYALAGSIEVGHSFDLAKDWIIEPQAQVKLAHINWDDFNDSVNDVSFEDHTYITGRAGVRVEKNIETSYGEIKPWAYIGVLHEFTDAPEVTYADTIFEAVDYNTAGEIKLGITADIYKSTQLYSDIGYATDFNDYNSVKGDLGLRITW